MGNRWATQQARSYGPGPGTEVAIATAASTSAVDLSTVRGLPVLLFWLPDTKGSGHSCHLRFGASDVGAATLDDLPLTEEHPSLLVVPHEGWEHFRAISAGGDGSLFWAARHP